jgi:hypothetical protein
MKDDYDFSNAEQGKFYVPVEQIELPIFLVPKLWLGNAYPQALLDVNRYKYES